MQSAAQPNKFQPDQNAYDPSWQGKACWRLLVTDFGDGLSFLQTWLRWRQDEHAPRLLHYVALSQKAPEVTRLQRVVQDDPLLRLLAELLAQQWYGLLPGFHRLVLDQGRVHLTLCIGDSLTLLRQQAFKADAIELSCLPADEQALHTLKGISRCCRRGTALTLQSTGTLSKGWLDALRTTGFGSTHDQTDSATSLITRYNPAWTLSLDQRQVRNNAKSASHCVVIGAGLAGASVASALAKRGWQVTVLERACEPASGASGLPLGLLVAHVSRDDCTLSQLSRAGVRLTLNEAKNLLKDGSEWAQTGVMEHRFEDATSMPPNWSPQGLAWCEPIEPAASNQDIPPARHALLHRPAGWLKPAALVKAWLAQEGITLKTNACVQALRRTDASWELLDASGQVLCEAAQVVMANALDATALLQQLASEDDAIKLSLKRIPRTHGLRGLLSWATHTASDGKHWPRQAMNGNGSATGHVPTTSGEAWFVGASYQDASEPERNDQDNHHRNLEKLRVLNPVLAQAMQTALETKRLHSWKGMRCATDDHLPLVGPVEDATNQGLWLCVGMGSRGMSLSVLCAELLAAHIGAEPLPLPLKLAKRLSAMRLKV